MCLTAPSTDHGKMGPARLHWVNWQQHGEGLSASRERFYLRKPLLRLETCLFFTFSNLFPLRLWLLISHLDAHPWVIGSLSQESLHPKVWCVDISFLGQMVKGVVWNLKVVGLGDHWSIQISPTLWEWKVILERFLWGDDFDSHERWVSGLARLCW